MVTMDEVLAAFPEREFLIQIKDGGAAIGDLLLAILQAVDAAAVA